MSKSENGSSSGSTMPTPRVTLDDQGTHRVALINDNWLLQDPQISELAEELTVLVELEPKPLMIDFTQVEHLHTAMLGKLITVQKKAWAAKCPLVLVGLNETVREIFKTSKLDTYFKIVESPEEGLEGQT